MRDYGAGDAQAALDRGEATAHGAIRLGLSTPALYWGGYGDLPLDAGFGSETYTGIGAVFLVKSSTGTIGNAALSSEITVSGVDPAILALIDTHALRGVSAVIWRLIFDLSGVNMLSANVHLRGRVDRAPRKDTIGGTSSLSLMIEGGARGLGLRSERMAADFDQRLIASADDGMIKTAVAPFITLNWGGKPPAIASAALPNSGGAAITPNQAAVNDAVNNFFR